MVSYESRGRLLEACRQISDAGGAGDATSATEGRTRTSNGISLPGDDASLAGGVPPLMGVDDNISWAMNVLNGTREAMAAILARM